MAIKPVRNGTRVQFECRLSFVHLDKPQKPKGSDREKYSVTCIIDKKDTATLEALRAAIDEAKEAGKFTKWKGIIPSNLKETLHDGDEPKYADKKEYAGKYFFGANSYDPVPVFNRQRRPDTPTIAYSGCYALVEVNMYPYDVSGAGVSAGLNQVLKLRDGERFGGGRTADAFAGCAIPEEEEDEDDSF